MTNGRHSIAPEAQVTELFDELRVPLLRYLLSFGLPAQDGEDVIQEVFLALFRHLRAGKPTDNLRGWVFRVGHNLALKRRAKLGRALTTDVTHQDSVPSSNGRFDPEAQLLSSRSEAQIRAAMQALPERDRWCLNLRAEGLPYREIAQTLGISIASVALSLNRSLSKLSAVAER